MPLDGMQLGHYRLLCLIGGGDMGEVYLAEDTLISRQVAIKVVCTEANFSPSLDEANGTARLFQREMKAITMLDHPYILPLYDVGEEHLHKVTFTYMVMPFRPEGSLADWLQQHGGGPLSPQDAVHFVHQAAEALQHAHDQQLIHRDVKPSNFLMRNRTENPDLPDLLLTDFGIAKFNTITATTTTQSIRGTPAYMAPEHWDGHPVPATDQYALAIMTYQLLVGYPPFMGRMEQVMRQHFTAQPQPPSTLNPAILPAIDAVILRALAKEPEERFPSISAFAHALQQAVECTKDLTIKKMPVVLSAHSPLSSDELRATLAISEIEAATGITRILRLPGGRMLPVTVPANVADGHVIRLNGPAADTSGRPLPCKGGNHTNGRRTYSIRPVIK
jgi:serine/threonine protein kinase